LYPELKLYPLPSQRRLALRTAFRITMRERRKLYWSLIALLGLLTLLGRRLSIASLIPAIPSWLDRYVTALCIIAGWAFLFRILWRTPVREAIRKQLNHLGVPICIGCGYDLTANTSGICPECGKRI
jgi:hypothetical protein